MSTPTTNQQVIDLDTLDLEQLYQVKAKLNDQLGQIELSKLGIVQGLSAVNATINKKEAEQYSDGYQLSSAYQQSPQQQPVILPKLKKVTDQSTN